jgi:hypothetical protein
VTTTLVGSTCGATTVSALRSRETLEATSFSASSGGSLPHMPATIEAVLISSHGLRASNANRVRVGPATSTGTPS